MAGAQPTLTAITDDASRGGLFTQSNIANPVSGADVQGNVVHDNTVTLTVTINGTPQVGTFTTNADADQNVNLTFTGIGGSGTGTGGASIVRGTIVGTNIVLELTEGPNVLIDISSLATDAELQQAINTLTAMIPTSIFQLTDTPNAIGGDGTFLGVVGGALTFTNPPDAMVSDASFTSTDMSVTATQSGAQVDLEARPVWMGNSGSGDNVGSTPTPATTVTVAQNTGLVVNNDGSGNLTIQLATPPIPPAEAPTPVVPGTSSALDTPSQMERTVRYDPEGTDTVTMVENVMVTGPTGAITIPPGNVQINAGSGEVIIPEMDAAPPGDYRVMADVTTRSTDGMETTTSEDNSFSRIIPFFQRREQPTDANPGTASTTPWTGAFTSIAGGGTLWIAVLDGELPDNTMSCMVGFGRPRVAPGLDASITVQLADGTTRDFDVFRFQANANQPVSDFSTSRR